MNKYVSKELGKQILSLLSASSFIALSIALPNSPQLFKLFNIKTSQERHRINQSLRCLEKRKFIKFTIKDGHETLEITQQGRKEALRYELDTLEIPKPKKWDNKWRIVIFDIPESRKKSRKEINFRLNTLGFYPYQKSIFIFPYECRNEIEYLCQKMYVRPYIKYILAQEVENQATLLKHFKLI